MGCRLQGSFCKYQQHSCSEIYSIPLHIPVCPPYLLHQNQNQTDQSPRAPQLRWKVPCSPLQDAPRCKRCTRAFQAVASHQNILTVPSYQHKQKCLGLEFSLSQENLMVYGRLASMEATSVANASPISKVCLSTCKLKSMLWSEQTGYIVFCNVTNVILACHGNPTELADQILSMATSSNFTSPCCIGATMAPRSPPNLVHSHFRTFGIDLKGFQGLLFAINILI